MDFGPQSASPTLVGSPVRSALTKNQKKKQRKKRARQGRPAGVSQEQHLKSLDTDTGSGNTHITLQARSDSIIDKSVSSADASAAPTVRIDSSVLSCVHDSNAATDTAVSPHSSQRPVAATAQHGELAPAACALQQLDLSAAALCISVALQQTERITHSVGLSDSGKRKRPEFIHGNYSSYYGYRLSTNLEEDPRLQVFQKHWFSNKRCLDIGCNAGLVTIALALRFGSAAMLGVDIDDKLIQQSCRNLKAAHSAAHQQVAAVRRQHGSVDSLESISTQRKIALARRKALSGVWFRQEDFVAAEHEPASVDCVTCLSVTKWVHLNGGDAALQRLFSAVRTVLTPGGHFVLEAQPWHSYKRARHKVSRQGGGLLPLTDLTMHPSSFCDYLVETLGFVFVCELHVAESAAGFDRPIWILQRGHN